MFVVSLNCILIRSLPLAVLTLVDKETQSLANGETLFSPSWKAYRQDLQDEHDLLKSFL